MAELILLFPFGGKRKLVLYLILYAISSHTVSKGFCIRDSCVSSKILDLGHSSRVIITQERFDSTNWHPL